METFRKEDLLGELRGGKKYRAIDLPLPNVRPYILREGLQLGYSLFGPEVNCIEKIQFISVIDPVLGSAYYP